MSEEERKEETREKDKKETRMAKKKRLGLVLSFTRAKTEM